MKSVFETYDRLVASGGAPSRSDWLRDARLAFERRTGAFRPEDPWFEARTRAFWDDILTSASVLALSADLDGEDQAWIPALLCAHRGLFRVARGAEEFRIEDTFSGAAFRLDYVDDSLRPGFITAEGLFDGRVVSDRESGRLALLPGAFFHPTEATAAIAAVVSAATVGSALVRRPEGRLADVVLDPLLQMERTFRTLSRVKASYAYRPIAMAAR